MPAKIAQLETRLDGHEDRCTDDRRLLYKALSGALALSLTMSGIVLERIIALTAAVERHEGQVTQVRSDVVELRSDVKQLLGRK